MSNLRCVVYAWDDGWGEEHWWVDDVEMIDGKPIIRDEFFDHAQGSVDGDEWTLEELIDEHGDSIKALPLVVFGGDDGTIDLANRTVG
jgi:hypothetical protein